MVHDLVRFLAVPGPPRPVNLGLKHGRVVENEGFKKVGFLVVWIRFGEALRPLWAVLL